MGKGNGESGSGRPSTAQAADWFAHNEAGTAFNAQTLMEWDGFASSIDNRQEYAEIAEIRMLAKKMEAPTEASRGELLADLESEFDRDDEDSK